MRFGFHQAEGLIGFLVNETVDSLEGLDALAKKASYGLPLDATSYYKCDLSIDGKIVDRFDLMLSKGYGVDDLGRTPSQVLRCHRLV